MSKKAEFNLSFEEDIFLKNLNNEKKFLITYKNDNSVIMGLNQLAPYEIDIPYCFKNNIKVIRRISGGGCVFHDKSNLNISIIDNRSYNPKDFLQKVCYYLQEYFDKKFEVGEKFDIFFENKKVSGSAFCYKKNKILHHFTLLLDCDKEKMSKSLKGLKYEKDLQVKGNFINSRPTSTLNLANLKNIDELESFLIKSIQKDFDYIIPHYYDVVFDKYFDYKWNYLRNENFEITFDEGKLIVKNGILQYYDEKIPQNILEYFQIMKIL